MPFDNISKPERKRRNAPNPRTGVVKERLGRLNATELPIRMWYRNEALLPESLKDIFPKKGEKHTFPFLTAGAHEEGASKGIRFAVRRNHERTAYLGECHVVDEFGTPYIYMDVKGMGRSTVDHRWKFISTQWRKRPGLTGLDGVLMQALADNDQKYSDIFARAGIAGHRVPVLFEYLELETPSRGGGTQLVATRTLRRRSQTTNAHALPDRAVGAVRIFSEIRLNAIRSKAILPNLFKRINHRFGTNIRESYEYGVWLAKQLGENLAIMHKLDCTHEFLSPHNILADGSFIDLDSVTGPEDYGSTRGHVSDDARPLETEARPSTFGEKKKRDYSSLERVIDVLMYKLCPAVNHSLTSGIAKIIFMAAYRSECLRPRISRFEK